MKNKAEDTIFEALLKFTMILITVVVITKLINNYYGGSSENINRIERTRQTSDTTSRDTIYPFRRQGVSKADGTYTFETRRDSI